MKKLQSALLLAMSIVSASVYAQNRMADPNQNSTLGTSSSTYPSTNPNGEITPKPNADMSKKPMEDYSSNTKSSTTAAMEQSRNQEQMHKEWMSKQWDKNQWETMSSAEKKEYKERHKVMWNSMTPDERAKWNKDHEGQTDYMNKRWYQRDKNK